MAAVSEVMRTGFYVKPPKSLNHVRQNYNF